MCMTESCSFYEQQFHRLLMTSSQVNVDLLTRVSNTDINRFIYMCNYNSGLIHSSTILSCMGPRESPPIGSSTMLCTGPFSTPSTRLNIALPSLTYAGSAVH